MGFVCCWQDLFQPAELQAMVVGNENYDWHELERVSRRCTDSRIRFIYYESHTAAVRMKTHSKWLSLQDTLINTQIMEVETETKAA